VSVANQQTPRPNPIIKQANNAARKPLAITAPIKKPIIKINFDEEDNLKPGPNLMMLKTNGDARKPAVTGPI